MKRKVIAAVTAFAMLTGMFSASFAASDSASGTLAQVGTYKDIGGHWAQSAIGKWSGYGVISGSQGLFRPDASITRGEMACILNNIMDYQISAKNTFSDLKDGQFYTNSVLKANAAGIMNGDGVKLRPTDKITREEAAVMLAKAFAVSNGDIAGTKFSDAEEMASWAKASVSGMEAGGYIKGNDGKYNPKANITRAETVAIINNIVKEYYTKAGTYTEKVEGTAVVKASGVVLKGTAISGNLIIAEGVGQGDATLDSVTVKGNTVVRGGGQNSIHIEGTSSLGNIKLEKNGDKLRIVIADGSTVKSMEVADGEEIVITGPVGTVEINASDVKVQAAGAKIANTVISGANSSISLDKESKIGELSINGKADNTEIKTEKGASVGKITAAAKTAVSGKGSIKEVNLNEGAKNSSITTPDTQIKAAAGVTGVTGAGGTAISAGSTITNNGNGDGIVTGQVPTQIPVPVISGGTSGGSSSGNSGNSGSSSVTVTGIAAISPITVDNGTVADKLGLPATVDVTLSDSTTAKANVLWNTASFIGTKTGEIILKGTLSVPSGSTWTMTDAQKAVSVMVTVRADALDVKLVMPLNGKVVELSLYKAVTAAYIAGKTFTVNNASGDSVGIAGVDIAPWSNKSVLVTLDTDLISGNLYTLTVSGEPYTFTGTGNDSLKPKVSSITASNINEVTITFDEVIKLETLKAAIAEADGTKQPMEVKSLNYKSGNSVVLSVGDMKDATLYKCIVTDVTDLAGNQMEDNSFEANFTGKSKQTALKFNSAFYVRANNSYEVAVKFNVAVDPATLVPANFTVQEMYGTKETLKVKSVRLAGKGDTDTEGNTVASDSAGSQYAIITLDGAVKQYTLYKVQFSNLRSLYGVEQSSDSQDIMKQFPGTDNQGIPVTVSSSKASATSNTTFSVSFSNTMNGTSAEKISSYTLEEAETKEPLAILKIKCDGTTVTFTTAPMKSVGYKLTINNIKDIYDNSIKNTDSANIVTVRGVTVEEAARLITRIESISRNVPSGSTATFNTDTQIVVDFDNNVGTNATDVTLYTIDGGIGNPTKVERVDGTGNEDKVILTIGKTTAGSIYKLTVKGLLNADGIASADVVSSFAGLGNSYSLPKMQSAAATDEQTLKICFDRNVDSSDIKGSSKIWTENGINTGALRIKYASETDLEYHNLPANKAWKDPDNANVLIIRTGVSAFNTSAILGSQLVLDGTGTLLDEDNDNITFESNDSEVARPQISRIISNDDRNITVYFDQAVLVNGTSNQVFTIGTNENATYPDNTEIAVGTTRPIKIDEKTYKICLNSSLTNSTYYLRIADLSDITDKSGYFNLKPVREGSSYCAVQFSGSAVHVPVYITNVSVLMNDNKTIQLYYPERMDKVTVTNPANYRIYQTSDGTVAASGTSVPTAVVYDAETSSATLYLSGTTISGAANNTYYLGIKDTVTDEIAYKVIKSDKVLNALGNGILIPFGLNTSDDTSPSIKNVTVDYDDNKKITVEFDEVVSTAQIAEIISSGIATKDNQIVINDAQWGTVTTSSAIDLFAITDTTTGSAVSIVSVKKVSNTRFEVVTATPIEVNHAYELAIGDTKNIYNLGGTQVETDVNKIQKYMFTSSK